MYEQQDRAGAGVCDGDRPLRGDKRAGLSQHGYPGLPPDQPVPSLEESMAGLRFAARPGAGYLYSGGGYTVLQLVIEEITGEAFATYMRREVLDPLGMTLYLPRIPSGQLRQRARIRGGRRRGGHAGGCSAGQVGLGR